MTTKDPNLIKTPINHHSNDNNLDELETSDTIKSSAVDKNNRGNATVDADIAQTEHVKEGDHPARQPDRRDQEGQTPFDGGVNADEAQNKAATTAATTKSEEDTQLRSAQVTDENRYASVDNAQTRVLPEADKPDVD